MIRIKSYCPFPDILIDADTFQNADFSGISFHRYLFEDFDMSGCCLKSFKGVGVIFKNSILRNADLTNATLVNARIIDCNFKDALLKKANLMGVRVRGTSTFEGADFTGANLKGTNFLGAILAGAILTNAVYDSRTVWPINFLPEEHGAVMEGPIIFEDADETSL